MSIALPGAERKRGSRANSRPAYLSAIEDRRLVT
jgi:hypothetical protein